MRVALVLEQFDPPRGGLEQWTSQFAARLAQRGHEVHVLAERFGEQSQAMPIIPHPLPPARSRIAFAEAAQAELWSLAPDVIHDMGSGWYCDVFQPHGGSWTSLARRKLLYLPRWMRPLKREVDRLLPRHREYSTLLGRQYADNGQILVALSQSVAEDFQRFHGVRPERIRLIYNGVDTDRFSPARRAEFRSSVRRRLGLDDETVLLLIVTHNFRLKGVPTLLRAMARLRKTRPPVHLAVVGGKHLGRYARAARRLGLQRTVSFVGSVDDTVPYYAAADAYIHPTFYDACSLVVLEALASGLPVVTTRLNGAAELLHEGREGYVLADAADVHGLLERIEALLDPATRQRMGAAARRLALRHTLATNVDQVLAVYEEAARTKRQPTAAPYNRTKPRPVVASDALTELQPAIAPHAPATLQPSLAPHTRLRPQH